MSESDTTERSADEFAFPDQQAAETLVRTLRDHRGFCYWCLAPLEVNPLVKFPGEPEGQPLETAKTFDKYGHPENDVPPDRKDEQGQVVEHSREEVTICGSCGVFDPNPDESRDKETTRQALIHVCSVLEENETGINRMVADESVTETFAKGHTGQFCETLGTAIHRSTE